MKSVFISYSLSDPDTANWLAEMLKREGVAVSRVVDLTGPSDLQTQILSAIGRCDLFIAFVDEVTADVMFELGYALGVAKQVLLVGGECAGIPFDVASLPVVRVDRHDDLSLLVIIDWIRSAASADAPPVPKFVLARDHIEYMLRHSSYLERIAPEEFESSVRAFLQELGLDAEQMPVDRSWGGYDILVREPRTSLRVLVQVKKYAQNSLVGVEKVRSLLGATMVEEASGAILVTTSSFSSSARSFAQRAPVPILLMTLGDLVASTRESIMAAWN